MRTQIHFSALPIRYAPVAYIRFLLYNPPNPPLISSQMCTHRNGRTKVWGIVNYFPYLQKRRPTRPPVSPTHSPAPSSPHIRTHHIYDGRDGGGGGYFLRTLYVLYISRASSILAHIYFICGKCASGRAVAKEHCMHIYTPKWNVRFIFSPTMFWPLVVRHPFLDKI